MGKNKLTFTTIKEVCGILQADTTTFLPD